ncbi:MAG: biotin--[acetyl-CoA-carboxylase] ligase [Desulfosarcina sp.]|nr:biotin--[acetyl-CoA-carboxylase] ligase [Desulfobacterales bacterium]
MSRIKQDLLTMLRESREALSGEQLSARLGVSRVTVWKHVQALQALGYPIDASRRGYCLADTEDVLQPWEFPGREDRMHCHREIDSTMNAARALARQGCPEFTVVTADRQTQGRGRMRRSWHSADGGLYFTVVLRPELPAALGPLVTFAAGVVWGQVLSEEYGLPVGLKWPNDMLVEERKVSGMLSEMETRGDMVNFVNIGIGLNVNNDPTPTEPGAVSLKQLVGKPLSRRVLLTRFLDRFERRVDGRLADVIEEWKHRTVTLNRPVRIQTIHETISGIARDVDDSGALILEQPDGSLQRVVHGDCFHQ